MDRARDPLFERVDESVFQRPTFNGKLQFSIAYQFVCKSSLIQKYKLIKFMKDAVNNDILICHIVFVF